MHRTTGEIVAQCGSVRTACQRGLKSSVDCERCGPVAHERCSNLRVGDHTTDGIQPCQLPPGASQPGPGPESAEDFEVLNRGQEGRSSRTIGGARAVADEEQSPKTLKHTSPPCAASYLCCVSACAAAMTPATPAPARASATSIPMIQVLGWRLNTRMMPCRHKHG